MQLVATARALSMQTRVIVMDEATSALDYNTEKQLCANLQEWAKGKTVLFITHRLNTIKSSDRILVMHEGSLVECGTHEQLMSNGQRYSALFVQQSD